ncbi:hypothetical protein [Methylocella sp.]|uniref:hypothetical protein n=1 Tax=Methylocella sp. TaxID=1978226 RepID=UPI003784B35B
MSKVMDFEEDEKPSRLAAWLGEAPFLGILALTLLGVGYMSMARRPLIGYWEFVAVVTGVVCVASSWAREPDAAARWRLVWTQALHWSAFLIAMNLVLLPSVRAIADDDFTSLVILLLLGLGVFIAGVHTGSWRLCLNGLVMALCVPGVAWIDQSAFFLLLVAVAVIAIGGLFLLRRRDKGAARRA